MTQWFIELDAILQAALAGGLTWLVTAMGAALVFPFQRLPRTLLDAMLGFAAGVMIAASFWSLLVPSIEIAVLSGGPDEQAHRGIEHGHDQAHLHEPDRVAEHLVHHSKILRSGRS